MTWTLVVVLLLQGRPETIVHRGFPTSEACASAGEATVELAHLLRRSRGKWSCHFVEPIAEQP
jgi:hypothetical protein